MVSKVKELIKEKIEESGYILDDVIYVNENGYNFLRIIIDKKGDYININDCVVVNDLIDGLLDDDLIEESYILDVCSKEKGSK